MASYTGSSGDHHESFTTNYPHSLRTRGATSPYAPNRSTTFTATPNPTLQRRPPIPEVRNPSTS